jgi:hypothetical protein
MKPDVARSKFQQLKSKLKMIASGSTQPTLPAIDELESQPSLKPNENSRKDTIENHPTLTFPDSLIGKAKDDLKSRTVPEILPSRKRHIRLAFQLLSAVNPSQPRGLVAATKMRPATMKTITLRLDSTVDFPGTQTANLRVVRRSVSGPRLLIQCSAAPPKSQPWAPSPKRLQRSMQLSLLI